MGTQDSNAQGEAGPNEPHVFKFEMTPVNIGRSRDCDLSFSSEVTLSRVISKKHARLYPCVFEKNEEVRWFLKDLDTKHGTSVNDRDLKADASIQIFDGDKIVLARQHGDFFQITCHLQGRGNSTLVLITSTPLNTRAKPGCEKRKLDGGCQALRKRFRALEANPLSHGDSPLKCPICFDFFIESHTLSCSHSFCGGCLRSWLRQSLTCPTCRVPVNDMPVRTRALDDLCLQLVDPEDQTWKARRETHEIETARQIRRAKRIRKGIKESQALPWPNVWSLWHNSNDKHVFSHTVANTVGAEREAWCEAVGLTEASIEMHSKAKLAIACANLLEDCRPSHIPDLRHRLRMFLRYG